MSEENPTRLEVLASELVTLRSEIDELDALETPTEEQNERFSAALSEWDEKDAEHGRLAERAAKVEKVRAASHETPANRERTTPSLTTSTRRDPFEGLEAMRAGIMPIGEIQSRAMDVVETSERIDDDAKECVSRLLGGKGSHRNHVVGKKAAAGIARHILETGSEEYHDHFERYVEDPQGYGARAALSLTSANGGYLVPFTFDPTIILTNSGAANPFRAISNVKTTATNNWNGVTSAGVNAGWLAEAAVAPDASPTFANLQITPAKAAAWVFGSYEVFEDSDFGTQLPGLLADAKNRLEETAFATGSGTTQPWGVVTRATTVASATAATYASADVYAVQAALPARFRGAQAHNAWVASQGIINRTRQFDTAGGSSFWANLGMDQPERLLGAPIFESTSMVSTITTGSKNLLLGDFSQYYIVDRIGMSVIYEPLLQDQATGRPAGQGGWFAFWRVGADVSTTSAFRVLTEA
jgi:HK97 family phage major capsid protein